MESPVRIENLPYEVLERILSAVSVSAEDVISCSTTCKYLNGVCQRNSLWKVKFRQHYAHTYSYSESSAKEKVDWRARFTATYRCRRRLVQCVFALSRTFVWSMYHDYEWPDIPRRALALYETLFQEELGEANMFYILDECHNILSSDSESMDLTLKYYAEKVYNHIYDKCVISTRWRDFTQLPEERLKYSYEQGLLWVIVSLQTKPAVCNVKLVSLHLDTLAKETLVYIKSRYPEHPICEKTLSKLDYSRETTSVWKGEHCSQIMQAVHHVIRHITNFRINNSLCESGPDHYCIDRVLVNKKGSSKLILVIESCVANRLGVHTEVHKSSSGHVLDTWKLYYIGQDGTSGYATACALCREDATALSIVHEDWQEGQTVDAPGMCKAIIQQIVFLAECWLKSDRWQAGEPALYDLLDEETYHQPIRLLFTAWQHVEHWKMSKLYHYMHQHLRVAETRQTLGKLLHLSILLRINSKLTLEKLLNFRRRMGQPPNTMRDLLRMLASVDKRARTRVAELKNLLSSGAGNYSSLNPLASVPWPHGWPGGEMVQKRRVDRKSWQVQFAVGEVLEQRGGDLCVVYDWDSMCVESEDTLVLMGETGLAHGTDQPFYRVLTDGGSARYLAQENLRHARQPRHLKNPLIGRYFTAFIYPFYIPNPQKAYEYPEDPNIREQNALSLKLKFAANE
ncbi:F-box only protein 21-like [Penaeus chinensis]|uniref:F-box only protein 21-like n=1 Tax=Penaeus chinensis TaxID=139456 RepID=UPI001FB7724D|nr:F-box only protein 21-like [Penaeus chinensis]